MSTETPIRIDGKRAHTALRAVETALVRGAPAQALEPARRAWESARTAELAALVERISSLVEAERPALAIAKREAMQREWLAIEAQRDARDLPRLVRALVRTHGRSTDATVRAKRLAAWPPDPRIPALVLEHLMRPEFRASSARPFWTGVFALFLRHADPRASALLASYAGTVDKILPRREDQTMRSWLSRTATATATALAALFAGKQLLAIPEVARAARALEASIAARARVFAGVFANPDDDAAREVCGDQLQELGDPRGELIALQLAEARGTTPASGRVEQLVAEHAETLLGDLRDVLVAEYCAFDRGFLDHAAIVDGEELLARRIGNPWWSTVTSISGAWSPTLGRLVADKGMRGLRELGLRSGNNWLDVFDARDLPIRSLRFYGPDYHQQRGAYVFDAAEVKRMASSRAMPRLVHVGLDLMADARGGPLGYLKQIPWARRLEAITLSADHWPQPPIASWLSGLATFEKLSMVRIARDEMTISIALKAGRVTAIELACPVSWCANVFPPIEEIATRGVQLDVQIAPAAKPAYEARLAALAARGVAVTRRADLPIQPRWWPWQRRRALTRIAPKRRPGRAQ